MRALTNFDSEPVDAAAWDSFVAGSAHGHLLQTSRWGALKKRFGWEVERVVLTDGDAIVAGAQVLYRSLLFGLTLAYVPMGPLVDWDDEKAVRTLLSALRQAAQRRGAFGLKLEPSLLDDPTLARRLEGHGFRASPHTVQPRCTLVADLTPSLDEILARMKPKTRYNIRLARRKEVVVREGIEADLPCFHQLMQLTGRRDGFPIYSKEYYEAIYRLFVPAGLAKVFLASYRGEVLAGLMAFALGRRAWYLYGASSNEHRDRMPNYLLQWEAMRWAKEKGCLTYDLWGIPDEDQDVLEREFPKRCDGLWGVYRFKRGFGVRLVRHLGAYDDVYLYPLYWLYNQAHAFLQQRWGEAWHRRLSAG